MDLALTVSRLRMIKISNNSPRTSASPCNSLPHSPRIPLSIQRLINKPRGNISFIPSLVLTKRKRKTVVIPQVHRKYHEGCYYNRKVVDPVEKFFRVV
ncbi:hypothetical protein SteCoe_28136 [Stentor coeruleus]|uniref:Uncharacterized protein n=1 Tax=Stentor coeruleus TaxID=5963 RepID=A0A1R2B8X4_9CILI|nr:hypothetical protein SteCoe_28136 [Stentor coeruleus]